MRDFVILFGTIFLMGLIAGLVSFVIGCYHPIWHIVGMMLSPIVLDILQKNGIFLQ